METLETSFSELIKSFSRSSFELQATVGLTEGKEDEKLIKIASQILELEKIFRDLQNVTQMEKNKIGQAKEIISVIQKQTQELEFIKNNLPPLTPVVSPIVPIAPLIKENSDNSIVESTIPTTVLKKKLTTTKRNFVVPKIEHLTAQELDSIPTYIKARTTVDKANQLIDEIKLFLDKKYEIFSSSSHQKLTPENAYKLKIWKEQEDLNSKGFVFFADSDKCVKNDATSKAVLAVLIHAGRLRTLPGPPQLRRVGIPIPED